MTLLRDAYYVKIGPGFGGEQVAISGPADRKLFPAVAELRPLRCHLRPIGAVAAALALALLAVSCETGAKPAPIVGYWSFKGGVVQLRAAGSGFEGVVVRRPQDGPCAEPLGYVLLKLKGSGGKYSGNEEWWQEPSCERRYSTTATVKVEGNTAHLCSGDPFSGPPATECVDMTRVAKP